MTLVKAKMTRISLNTPEDIAVMEGLTGLIYPDRGKGIDTDSL